MPLVSVVLIFLDEEVFLDEAVQSVLDQTLTDWELILVDDGSTDASTRIARDWATRDPRICYIDHERHENREERHADQAEDDVDHSVDQVVLVLDVVVERHRLHAQGAGQLSHRKIGGSAGVGE